MLAVRALGCCRLAVCSVAGRGRDRGRGRNKGRYDKSKSQSQSKVKVKFYYLNWACLSFVPEIRPMCILLIRGPRSIIPPICTLSGGTSPAAQHQPSHLVSHNLGSFRSRSLACNHDYRAFWVALLTHLIALPLHRLCPSQAFLYCMVSSSKSTSPGAPLEWQCKCSGMWGVEFG